MAEPRNRGRLERLGSRLARAAVAAVPLLVGLPAAGLDSFGLGLRFRYEIRRELAPHLGVSWRRKTGGSADFARLAGEDPGTAGLVAGFRMWW